MSIIGNLPNNLTNGTTADATQVMANFNTIVNAVNNSSTGAASIPGVQASSYNYAADSGTVNNIIIGMTPSPAVYTDGLQGNFKAANTNTSTTVNIKYGSLGNKALVIDQAGTLPPIGSIISGMHYRTEYDSTQDKVILINPSRSTNSFTLNLTGMSSATSGAIGYAIDNYGKGIDIWCVNNILGTSNAPTMTGTGVPTELQATTDHPAPVNVVNNGANVIGVVSGLNTTTWAFSNGAYSNTWTNTGTKGLQIHGFRYTKD